MFVTPALYMNPTMDSTQKNWDKVFGKETSYGLVVEVLCFPDRLFDPHSLPFGG
jgi:hypothetical protein